ncbi:MAG: ParB/RepB/Spo0J family partition protein, partial [Steroidobacteraceae bacterium]
MSAQLSEVRALPLAAITLSTTPAQVERRAHLDKVKLTELAESIKAHGLVQPILVRPFRDECVKGDAYELVAGERRYLAARQAGLEAITATVRELTDEQVTEIQLVENLQRQDLHELAEAEGYEQLAKLGHSAEDIAAKVGKSRGTVYARMKLLALIPEARQAYYAGKLTASIALLIARIPGEDQQQRALATITEEGWKGRTMTYREAADYVHETFMLKLSSAPFPRDDETLVADAGACGPCPMRTGNQPELFGDVKGADICTSPQCFAAKKAAHVKRELEKAKATGERVIRGGEARRILPDSRGYCYSSDGAHKQLRNGYARPGDKCFEDPKKRTYA